jgi:uncharacterized protein YegP (UPF0339 family)
MSDTWSFYLDHRDQWRWRRQSPNGKIIASSSESYKNFEDMMSNAVTCGFPPDVLWHRPSSEVTYTRKDVEHLVRFEQASWDEFEPVQG